MGGRPPRCPRQVAASACPAISASPAQGDQSPRMRRPQPRLALAGAPLTSIFRAAGIRCLRAALFVSMSVASFVSRSLLPRPSSASRLACTRRRSTASPPMPRVASSSRSRETRRRGSGLWSQQSAETARKAVPMPSQCQATATLLRVLRPLIGMLTCGALTPDDALAAVGMGRRGVGQERFYLPLRHRQRPIARGKPLTLRSDSVDPCRRWP